MTTNVTSCLWMCRQFKCPRSLSSFIFHPYNTCWAHVVLLTNSAHYYCVILLLLLWFWHTVYLLKHHFVSFWLNLCSMNMLLTRHWWSLLSQIIDHTQRLGCAESGGYAALKAHGFFDGTAWGTLHLQNAPELHPFLPANSEDSENLWSQYEVLFWLIVMIMLM